MGVPLPGPDSSAPVSAPASPIGLHLTAAGHDAAQSHPLTTPDIARAIGSYLSAPRDLLRWASVCKDSWQALDSQRAAIAAIRAAKSVDTLPACKAVIASLASKRDGGIPQSKAPWARIALWTLAGSAPRLPMAARPAAFTLIGDAIAALPAPDRTAPLAALATQLPALHEADRWPELVALREAARALPQEPRANLMVVLIGRLWTLPRCSRWPEFSAMLDAANGVPEAFRSGPLIALAEAISILLPSDRAPGRGQIGAVLSNLPAGVRLRVRIALLATVHETHRKAEFLFLLGQLAWLADRERLDCQLQLCEAIRTLLPNECVTAFAVTLDTIDTEPPEQRHAPLCLLATQIGCLPTADQSDAIFSIIDTAAPLPAGERADVLHQMAGQLSAMARTGRTTVFDLLQQETLALPPQHHAGLLAGLCRQVQYLLAVDRPARFTRLALAISALPEAQGALAQAVLDKQIRILPSDQRPGVLGPTGPGAT